MRRYYEPRVEEGGFNDAIQGLVRNSPWWMTSAVIHGIILLILAQIPFQIRKSLAPACGILRAFRIVRIHAADVPATHSLL